VFQTNKVISVICILLYSTAVHAALIARDSDQALTSRPNNLQIGRSVFGFRTDFIQSSKRLNNKGKKENLGQMFEQKIVDSEGERSERYEFEASYLQITPYWGYGLTSSWSIYFGVPLYQVQTKTKSTEKNRASQSLASTNLKLNSRTPETPQNESSQMFVGQAVLGAQYLMIDGVDHKLGLTQKLRFPSAGRDDSIYFTHGAPEALGYGFGAGFNYEYTIASRFSFIGSAETVLNLNDEVYVQQSGEDLFEADRNPGETTTVRASLERGILQSSYLQLGVSLEQKTEDKLEFAVGDDEAYQEAEARRLLVAYEYRPREQSRSYNENAVSGRLSYSHLLSGENVAAENSAAVELRIAY
jgi:opacity protein-like surface antigen